MGRADGALRLEDKLKAQDELYARMLRPEGKGPLLAVLAAVLLIHVTVALIPLPSPRYERSTPVPSRTGAAVHGVVPAPLRPPPPPDRTAREVEAAAARESALEPFPEPAEPLHESEPDIGPGSLPPEAAMLLGTPEPPPSFSPAQEDAGEVTEAVLVPESKVPPVFPSQAWRMRIPGSAVLKVDVRQDGTVGGIEALRCIPPDFGFCEAAAAAVRKWRFRPAVQSGRPVQVSITVRVNFVVP